MTESYDLLNGQLDEAQIRQIAQSIGANEEETRNAIAAAIPTLIGGLGRAAESPEGAERITSQIQAFGSLGGGDIFSNLPAPRGSSLDKSLGPGNELPGRTSGGSPLGGRPGSSPQQPSGGLPGGDMLDQIFGGKKKRVEEAVGKSSGLDLKKVGPLLAILAPIILGALRSKASAGSKANPGKKEQFDPGSITDILRGERTRVESKQGGSLIGRILDQDGDGDFDFADILKLGMRFLGGRK